MLRIGDLKTIAAAVVAAAGCLLVVEILMVHDVSFRVLGVRKVFSGNNDDLATRRLSNKTEVARLERFLDERAVRLEGVDCKGVVEGNNESLTRANRTERLGVWRQEYDEHILRAASTCASFVERYGFITDSLTDLEETFPLAFSILAYKDAAQVVFMLRAIYRPQNSYCLHADRKSRGPFRDALKAVSRCLPGVFMASRAVDVGWGGYGVLEADIVCMRDLVNSGRDWRYFINLSGQEFPLKTNFELVRILRTYHGANDVHGFIPNVLFQRRWKRHLPAPYNLTVYAGAVQVTVSRQFVEFLLHNQVALAFLNWTSKTQQPDENYFATLNYNVQLRPPGGFNGHGNMNLTQLNRFKPYLSRLKNWVQNSGQPCPGHKVVRQLCIFSVLDVPWMVRKPHFFANKFYLGYSRVALGCLAEELFNRTRDQTLGRRDFDMSFYNKLPYIKHKMTF